MVAQGDEDVDHLRDLASEAPIIRLVNRLILDAVQMRASDIHFEPFEENFKVRYRLDGVLHEVHPGAAAVGADVDIADVRGETKVVVVHVELQLRRQGWEIDRRGPQFRIDRDAGPKEVAVDVRAARAHRTARCAP